MSKTKNKHFISHSQQYVIVLVILVTGLVAAMVIALTQAAIQQTGVEAEDGASDIAVSDNNASGGRAINFKSDGSGGPGNNEGLEQFRYNGDSGHGFNFSDFAGSSTGDIWNNRSSLINGGSDNGDHPDGNFRIWCHYSHILYDDPLAKPGKPGESHLHVFFGNTSINANTNLNSSLADSGGGSCQGGALNRTGYWMPALLDGQNRLRPPTEILVYYKTKGTQIGQSTQYPPGLIMFADKAATNGQLQFGWKCGDSGSPNPLSELIPASCSGGQPLQAAMEFPQCWDGTNLGSTSDWRSHMFAVNRELPCPSSHPKRVPQLSIKAMWYNIDGENLSNWYLSSDKEGDRDLSRGATLHSDWVNGWNPSLLSVWHDKCIRNTRNCSQGQTGAGGAGVLKGITGDRSHTRGYTGPAIIDLPRPLANTDSHEKHGQ